MTPISSITSLQNDLVKHLVKLRTENDYRLTQQTVMLEGSKPIKECRSSIKRIFYTAPFTEIAETFTNEKWLISEQVLSKISGLNSPEGLIAEVQMPPYVPLNQPARLVIFDGVSDPGNLGTLMRTALAFGWDHLFFLPNCCDPYNEKTLRAARGAHFKVEMSQGSIQDLCKWCEIHKIQPIAAQLGGITPEDISLLSDTRVLILGNEAHGVSENLKRVSLSVEIPMPGEMESLNVAVAGGILLYLLSRRKEI